jgi:hypothetical protein
MYYKGIIVAAVSGGIMSIINPRNSAEATDGLATLTACATAVAALIFALNFASVFVSEAATAVFGYVQVAGGVLIAATYLPLLIVLKLRGGQPAGRGTTPGYLSARFRQAGLTAFSLTVAFLVLLSVFGEPFLAHFSADQSIDLMLAFGLASFSLAFFVINRFSRLSEEAEAA